MILRIQNGNKASKRPSKRGCKEWENSTGLASYSRKMKMQNWIGKEALGCGALRVWCKKSQDSRVKNKSSQTLQLSEARMTRIQSIKKKSTCNV